MARHLSKYLEASIDCLILIGGSTDSAYTILVSVVFLSLSASLRTFLWISSNLCGSCYVEVETQVMS